MSSKRKPYIDIAKGLLILLVVHLHVGYYVVDVNQITNRIFGINYTLTLLYQPFFMPAFFIITGMCSNFKQDFTTFFLKNLKSLILPVVVIMLIYNIIFGDGISADFVLIKAFSRWFCFALFLSKIIYWVVSKLTNSTMRLIIVVLLSITACWLNKQNLGPNILYYWHGIAMVLFLEIGQHIKNNTSRFFSLKSTIICAIIFAITWVSSYLLFGYFPFITSVYNVYPATLISHQILAISGSIVVLGISKHINANSIIEYIGRESLMIYILHFIFIEFLISIFRNQLIENDIVISTLLYVLFFIVALFSSLLVSKLLDYKYLKWVKGR